MIKVKSFDTIGIISVNDIFYLKIINWLLFFITPYKKETIFVSL